MDDEITVWINQLKQGDPRSQQEIWAAYHKRLLLVISQKLRELKMREFDQEDVALSAFNSFFRAVKEQRVPKLDDRFDLWKVLVIIAARKGYAQRKRINAEKRGGGHIRGESVFAANEDFEGRGLEQILGSEPSPEFAAETAEAFERLMALLTDDTLRRIAQFKFEGYTNFEISKKIDCVERTIERKLERIRELWSEQP